MALRNLVQSFLLQPETPEEGNKMFTFRMKNETGLSDEEKKMAQELNEAIAKAEADKADRDEDSINFPDDDLEPVEMLSSFIAGFLSGMVADRFELMADKDYEMLPSYAVIGEKDGKVYIAEYPSDVQFNFEDEQATADYQAVFDELNKIRDGSGDSPIVLK